MKVSFKVALGGICMALAIVLMTGTAIIPILSFALPAFAGMMMIPINLQFGRKWAILVYIGVSFLSFFVTPDHTATISFAVLFGYYPILKGAIESMRKKALEWVLKMLVFNLAVALGAAATIALFGLDYLIAEYSEFSAWGMWAICIFALFCEGAFVLYDFALSKIVTLVILKFMPLFNKIK